MLINWKVRAKHPAFWIALIPAVLLFVKAFAEPFGYTLDLDWLEEDLVNIVKAIFAVLIILGIVVDPTTKGLSDSLAALQYPSPIGIIDQVCNLKNWYDARPATSDAEKEEQGEEKIGGSE